MATECSRWSATELWNQAMSILRKKVDENDYRQYFQRIVAVSVSETELKLGVNSGFFAETIDEKFGTLISAAVKEAAGCDIFYSMGWDLTYVSPPAEPEAEEPDAVAPVAKPAVLTAPNCNARYTFENFVVGEENRYAFSAAQTAATAPGTYNPLYIYGGTGMGKTHLMQAVANHVQSANPNAVVRYTTCEGFLNEYVDAIKNHTSDKFRDRFRNVDLLLVDDVHNLSGKEGLQEEFFNTVNAIYNTGKQIMMTSDKQPSEIKGLEARLVSRFQSGLTVQITTPSYQTRLAFLQLKQKGSMVQLPEEFLAYMARRISSSIRALDGARMRLIAYASLVDTTVQPLTMAQVETLLNDLLNEEAERTKVSIEKILEVVAAQRNLKVIDLTGSKRTKEIAESRMLAMYLGRSLTDLSLKDIGQAFGGRNHTTVIHAIKEIESSCEKNEELKRSIQTIKRRLHADA